MSLRDRLMRVERKLALSRSAVAAPTALILYLVDSREPPLPCDEAMVDDQMVRRLSDESQQDFERRLLGFVPRGRTALILMFAKSEST
jgi:hypothetical protein